MPSPKDITGALSNWKPPSPVSQEMPGPGQKLRPAMRRMRFDSFSWLTYWILAFALAGQFLLLFSLDLF